tara:strand:- start:948 stop:1280 length:333 start_codon:yes stop_codon:yes gene_type:complete
MLKIKNFPHCCTAKVLCGFGQTGTAPEAYNAKFIDPTVKQIKTEIGIQLNAAKAMGNAVVTVIVNDEQVNACQALKEAGFLSSDWMSKKNHPETKVMLWWFPLNEFHING